MSQVAKLQILTPDCETFPCAEQCCSAGCDVWPHERTALLASSFAKPTDFDDGYEDEEGDWLYRTALGPRGCTFLDERRGCRLHTTGLKPSVCIAVPRNIPEADEMAADGMLPCRADWRALGPA
ncbi:MAG TPA: hypothetical protein VGP07_18010 [Polyangia bacterium]|jgi:hypothetical protein